MVYDYMQNMVDDIINYIKDEEVNIEETTEEELYDTLWLEDSVTGNASGSYTFNSYKAKEYVMDNIGLLQDVVAEFCIDMQTHWYDWEYLDVSIRCYLLSEAISKAYEELRAE